MKFLAGMLVSTYDMDVICTPVLCSYRPGSRVTRVSLCIHVSFPMNTLTFIKTFLICYKHSSRPISLCTHETYHMLMSQLHSYTPVSSGLCMEYVCKMHTQKTRGHGLESRVEQALTHGCYIKIQAAAVHVL